ncbi:hypothetical protein LTR85_003287 [Meristemomyces frigidus]|nr:hypothetical protein LTR85_003287 [Meristemomyces frigidus]
MTATLLANELTHLISEAKRKNGELRTAAERSLQELKSLPNTSEQQLASDLSRRSAFIDPFLIACGTRNARFAGSGVTSLQRLVISKGLPRTRLKDALDAFNACTELGLDVQLKVLQALPSLLQNYADELKGELLAGALQVCASLQSSKVQTVSGVAAATLQQLVAAVFEKVGDEDRKASRIAATAEVPGDGESIMLRPAAFDAYRVFRDLVLAAEERPTKFVQLTALSPESCLELIWSCLNGNEKLFAAHPELISTVRSNLLPLGTRVLSEKLSFPITVRSMRILDLILSRHLSRFPDESEVTLGLLNHSLDADAAVPWKRALSMEVILNLFANGGLVIEAYAIYDHADGGKPIIQDVLSTFVRLSTEKPGTIGLGQQSSVPIGPTSGREPGSDQGTVEAAGGMAGVISSALGVAESSVSGISSQWSLPRTPCLDQLDKVEAPAVPETYVYAMVLDCLNSLSDCLARIVLPLTVQRDSPEPTSPDESQHANGSNGPQRPGRTSRSQSFRRRAVPVNPLELEGGPTADRIRAVAGLVDNCWPAVLATSSTFLNAALEDQYYRNLIKAYQRFAQVAGLLRLSTPRDALMTTLSKSAVPPHVLNTAMSDGMRSPAAESPRVFSNPKGLLSVDSLVSHASSLSVDRDRRTSLEPWRPMLTNRNLLCLRALLNLAIALGPTLGTAYSVVIDALRQADMILSTTTAQQLSKQGSSFKVGDSPAAVQAFSAEVAAVEGAASRLLESTADYPNGAFTIVLKAFTALLAGKTLGTMFPSSQASPPPTPTMKQRTFSGLPGISTFAAMQARDYQFVIPKLGTLAALNIPRFVTDEPEASGWDHLVTELVRVATQTSCPREARRAATDVLCKLAAGTLVAVVEEDELKRAPIQRRGLDMLLQVVNGIYSEDRELTDTDLEIQSHVGDALRAILERCGESLIAGWNKTLAIISSAFERSEHTSMVQQHNAQTRIDWQHVNSDFVSLRIGRLAFSATQLVCSDFLGALPTGVMPSMIELLHRFIGQSDDLNVALTAVTTAWNVADHLFSTATNDSLDGLAQRLNNSEDLEHDVPREACESKPAQLMLLLLRWCDAISTTQKEVRNATFQTICSIFKNHGNQLNPAAWDLMLRSVVMKIASDDVRNYFDKDGGEEDDSIRHSRLDESMSRTIITGTSDIIAQHIRTIEQVKKLPSLWEVFLNTLEAYLDCESHLLNAAVYTALSNVLSRVESGSTTWTTPIYRTVALWLKKMPEQGDATSSTESNQEAYNAYIDTAVQLYRLAKETMGSPQTRKLIDNVCECVEQSDGPRYGADVNNVSPLQGKALDLLRSIRLDLPNLPSRVISAASQFTLLHHESVNAQGPTQGPTFVALASESIAWLQALIAAHIGDSEISETGALAAGLRSLRQLIAAKYSHQTEHKDVALWRRATTTALSLAQPVLSLTESAALDQETVSSLWAEYATIAAGIAKANGLHFIEDVRKIYEDQLFDIESLKTLRDVLIPRLGRTDLPDEVRHIYCRSLFEASVVHQVEDGEVPEAPALPLDDILKIRRGRAEDISYSQREQMSYVCFSELIALASRNDEDSVERKKMAEAAGPLLILRLAIPIRAYIADQPLRGRKPQPLSELEELLFCFDQIKKLQLHPEALANEPVARGREGSNAHLHFLYPLLVKAVATAGDRWSGAEEVLRPLQSVLAAITPAP